MNPHATDHRRATAERNVEAILDAAERLLAKRTPLSMVALASEAGVSRPTVYAHFANLSEVVEAAVERAVAASVTAVEAADPAVGPAGEALDRLLAECWTHLARQDALANAAGEHVPADRLHRAHARLLTVLHELVERGQRDGAFRNDLPTDWLVTLIYAVLHAAAEHARAHRVKRAQALDMLKMAVRDLFAPRSGA
jgi:TetR/AcrR family transcriptional repressor of mexCD-oprJ operon